MKDATAAEMPVPVIHASEVHWLLNEQEDPAVVGPDETARLQGNALAEEADTLTHQTSAGLAAGEWLRQLFRPKPK
jgi:hypothetical protein